MGVPVVSVGNLTLGGTGKTPLVRWLARWFHDRGVRVAVVSRGYGANGGQGQRRGPANCGNRCPTCRTCKTPTAWPPRAQAIASSGLPSDRAGRRLSAPPAWPAIWTSCCLDALEPFGFGHVFPRGMLREPVEGLRRADVVVLSRADLLDPARRADMWQTVRAHAPQAVGAEVVHAPRTLISAAGGEMPLERCGASRWRRSAASAIRPAFGTRWRRAAAGSPAFASSPTITDTRRPSSISLIGVGRRARRLGRGVYRQGPGQIVRRRLGGRPLWAVGIEMEFLAGQEPLESRLRRCPRVRTLPVATLRP